MAGSHEVRGSIPLGSTKSSRFGICRAFFIFQRLMYYAYDWVRYQVQVVRGSLRIKHPSPLENPAEKNFKIGGCALKRFPYNSQRT